jgi:hypothetical protein
MRMRSIKRLKKRHSYCPSLRPNDYRAENPFDFISLISERGNTLFEHDPGGDKKSQQILALACLLQGDRVPADEGWSARLAFFDVSAGKGSCL